MVEIELPSVTNLDVPSHPAYLPLLRDVVSHAVELIKFDSARAKSIVLAVDEAFTNVIRHAYENRHNQRVLVTVTVRQDGIEVRLRDFGRKANPGEIKSRDIDDIRPGGLGVFLMQEIMDEVCYDSSCEVGTELRLTKYL